MIYVTDDWVTIVDLNKQALLRKVYGNPMDVDVHSAVQENWEEKYFNIRNHDNYFGVLDALNCYRFFGDSKYYIRVSEIENPFNVKRFLSMKGSKRIFLAECAETGRRVLTWTEFEVVN